MMMTLILMYHNRNSDIQQQILDLTYKLVHCQNIMGFSLNWIIVPADEDKLLLYQNSIYYAQKLFVFQNVSLEILI